MHVSLFVDHDLLIGLGARSGARLPGLDRLLQVRQVGVLWFVVAVELDRPNAAVSLGVDAEVAQSSVQAGHPRSVLLLAGAGAGGLGGYRLQQVLREALEHVVAFIVEEALVGHVVPINSE